MRPLTHRTALAVLAVAGIGLGVGTASAQDVAYTLETINPVDPFGDLPVDPTDLGIGTPALYVATLTPDQIIELNARCTVIMEWPGNFAPADNAFCERMAYEQGIIDYDELLADYESSSSS